VENKKRPRKKTMEQESQKKGQKKDQGCGGMGYVHSHPEQVGKVVDQRKSEHKKKEAALNVPNGQDDDGQKNRSQDYLKGQHQWDIFMVKKDKKYRIKQH
jgi:hypothetical protein